MAISKPMTAKQHYKAIVKKANSLNNKLRKLQDEARELIVDCEVHRDSYDHDAYVFYLKNLADTAGDLANFDFEDSIPVKGEGY